MMAKTGQRTSTVGIRAVTECAQRLAVEQPSLGKADLASEVRWEKTQSERRSRGRCNFWHVVGGWWRALAGLQRETNRGVC